jgi:hypothetical protein
MTVPVAEARVNLDLVDRLPRSLLEKELGDVLPLPGGPPSHPHKDLLGSPPPFWRNVSRTVFAYNVALPAILGALASVALPLSGPPLPIGVWIPAVPRLHLDQDLGKEILLAHHLPAVLPLPQPRALRRPTIGVSTPLRGPTAADQVLYAVATDLVQNRFGLSPLRRIWRSC